MGEKEDESADLERLCQGVAPGYGGLHLSGDRALHDV